MPRIQSKRKTCAHQGEPDLIAVLARELRDPNPFGQPIIDEEVFAKTNLIRVLVLWDRWSEISEETRTDVIRQAYLQAEGPETADRLVLINGLTFPEAYDDELLPFEVIALVRRDDKYNVTDCSRAMIEQGASILESSVRPRLWFQTLEQAEQCVARLASSLPGSDNVWAITQSLARTGQLVHAGA